MQTTHPPPRLPVHSAPLCTERAGVFLPLPVHQGQAEATKLILSLISMWMLRDTHFKYFWNWKSLLEITSKNKQFPPAPQLHYWLPDESFGIHPSSLISFCCTLHVGHLSHILKVTVCSTLFQQPWVVFYSWRQPCFGLRRFNPRIGSGSNSQILSSLAMKSDSCLRFLWDIVPKADHRNCTITRHVVQSPGCLWHWHKELDSNQTA